MSPAIQQMPYFPHDYLADAGFVCVDPGRLTLSLSSFVPDAPRAPFFLEPQRRLRRLLTRSLFTATMFWETLADQSTYTLTRTDLRGYGWPGPSLKLVGLLATFTTNLHPAFLLMAATLGHGRTDLTTRDITGTGRSVLTALEDVIGPRYQEVTQVMHDSLQPDSVPNSIRPFVPNGEEYGYQVGRERVLAWCLTARDLLRPTHR